MEDNCKDMVPYIVHESSMARQERTIKRLIIALIFSVMLAFTSNALWLLAWTSYDYTSEDISVDGTDGVANYIGNDGDINNGQDHNKKNDESSPNCK